MTTDEESVLSEKQIKLVIASAGGFYFLALQTFSTTSIQFFPTLFILLSLLLMEFPLLVDVRAKPKMQRQ